MNSAIKPSIVHKMNRSYTGKDVRIAVIDSGINPYHSHVNGVADGIQIRVNRDQYIEYHDDFRDRLGHGTAVAAAIRGIATDAELVGVKIFDDKLAAYPSVLAEAIEWSIENEVQIIHLSLGISHDYDNVKAACQKAIKHGIAVVAAMDSARGVIYPASYPDVFAVSAGEINRDEWAFHSSSGVGREGGGDERSEGKSDENGEAKGNAKNDLKSIAKSDEKSIVKSNAKCDAKSNATFIACGFPRELHGPAQLYNMHGHSFAAAHFTAYLSLLLEQNPEWTGNDLWSYVSGLRK